MAHHTLQKSLKNSDVHADMVKYSSRVGPQQVQSPSSKVSTSTRTVGRPSGRKEEASQGCGERTEECDECGLSMSGRSGRTQVNWSSVSLAERHLEQFIMLCGCVEGSLQLISLCDVNDSLVKCPSRELRGGRCNLGLIWTFDQFLIYGSRDQAAKGRSNAQVSVSK